MRSRLSADFRPEDHATVHRWARTLTVAYSLSLVALVAFVLVSREFAGVRLQTAGGVHATVTQP